MSLGKKLKKEDLRNVMKEYKKKLSTVKKIESPLAKYTETGQLMCILCQSLVRNESAWPVHVVSSKHKENIENAKKSKFENSRVAKRPASPAKEVSPKKAKTPTQVQSNPKLSGVPDDFFDKPPATKAAVKQVEDVEMDESINNKVEQNKKEADSCLPEGFFDDPVLDAKVRNVEYKNPLDDEWEKFQKEIKEEAAQSAQIIAEDQEEATAERQIEEIDEQLHNWSRVMDLYKLKESVQQDDKTQDDSMDETSSVDEDFTEEMDWRAKKSVK